MKHMSIPGLAVLALCTGLLAGCGGGHDPAPVGVETPDTSAVPEVVASSVEALVGFVKGLVSDDTAEPLSLGTVTLATDDTSEPAGL